MIYLDTSTVIALLHNRINHSLFTQRFLPNTQFALTVISLYELQFGFHMLEMDKKRKISVKKITREREAFEKLKRNLTIVNFDEKSAFLSSQIYHKLAQQGKIIEEFDCMIAGIIFSHGDNTIITQNRDHFTRIEDLNVISVD